LTFPRRVYADRDAADLNAAEEEAGGVELRHRAGEATDAADPTVLAERVEDFVEERPTNVVDRQIDAPGGEKFLHASPPLRVVRIERGVGADLAQPFRF